MFPSFLIGRPKRGRRGYPRSSSSRSTVTSSHAWLITHLPLWLLEISLPFFFFCLLKMLLDGWNSDWCLWPPIRSSCCLMIGELSSRSSQETFDTQRTKLALRSKTAQSIKWKRRFRDEWTLQPLTFLKNYLECRFEIIGGRCSSTVMDWRRWLAD